MRDKGSVLDLMYDSISRGGEKGSSEKDLDIISSMLNNQVVSAAFARISSNIMLS